jgi:hypothetical protein
VALALSLSLSLSLALANNLACSLQGTITGLERLSKLRVLSLTGTRVDSATLLSLQHLPHLASLNLSGVASLDETVALQWADTIAKRLVVLKLSECHLTDQVWQIVGPKLVNVCVPLQYAAFDLSLSRRT